MSICFFELFKKTFRKCSDYTFLIVIYHVLKELIDKLYFEISEIESSIIVAVVLICNI